MRITRSVLLLSVALASAGEAQQQPPQPAVSAVATPSGKYVMNFRDAEIRNVAEQVSAITGRPLVIDPDVTGKVTVIASDPIDVEGVWALFQSALRVNGFVAVRSGELWRVIPEAGAVQAAGYGRAASQDMVTRLLPLRNVPAETAQRVLRPLINASGSLEFIPDPNAIIVTDTAENVRRIEALAKSIDGGQGSQIEVIPLRFAAAADISQSIGRMLGAGESGGGVAPRIGVDERSNMLLVRGAPETVAEVRRLVGELDIPSGVQPVTRVIRLSHSDAEFVSDILRGVTGASGGSTSASQNPVARSLGANRSSSYRNGSGTQPPANGATSLAASLGVVQATPPTSTSIAAPTSGAAASTAGSPDLSIQAAVELNAIVAKGTPAALAELEALIRELDVRRPQVLIEAAIVEITGDTGEALGVQLGLGDAPPEGGLAATSFSAAGVSLQAILAALGEPVASGLAADALTAGYSNGNDFVLLVQALARSDRANLLSTPSITTLDNKPAEIVVGQNVPFRTGSFATSGNSRDPFTTIERQDIGITLEVVPRLYEGDVVRLDVYQEVSALLGNIAGAADIVTSQRSIQTTVLADDGEMIALGGLISDDRQSSVRKVPLLGDIPLIGRAFQSRSDSRVRRTLFVFLKPTILRSGDDAKRAAMTNYDRLRTHEASSNKQGIFPADDPPRLGVDPNGMFQK